MSVYDDIRWNDLFFVCSLIEYIARKTHNTRKDVVNAMGREGLRHYYDLADVYHCENIDKVTHEVVTEYGIGVGTYDNVSTADGNVPTHWDIGKVMCRIVGKAAECESKDVVDALTEVYNSWIVPKIDDYSCSMYYENNSYLYASYVAGHAL